MKSLIKALLAAAGSTAVIAVLGLIQWAFADSQPMCRGAQYQMQIVSIRPPLPSHQTAHRQHDAQIITQRLDG